MERSRVLDVSAFAAGGLLFGAFRRPIWRELYKALCSDEGVNMLISSLALPLGFLGLAFLYFTGEFFFNKGPEHGLLRLAVFGIAMMSGVLLAGF